MSADSLVGLLSDHGIKLKSYRADHSERVVCPQCGGGSKRDECLSVTIDPDGQGATWNCFRGNCGGKPGGARLHNEIQTVKPTPIYRKPRLQSPPSDDQPQWFWDFWSERKIGARAIKFLGIHAIETYKFGREGSVTHSPAIVFPFIFGGVVVNRKYRGAKDKSLMAQEYKALPSLFNVDALGEEPEEIVWVEGEPDVAAMVECSIPHAVTLKDGAGGGGNGRFAALDTHHEMLSKARRIVLAGDNDKPGGMLRDELARRLGRHRCFTATWPDGCKDAGDTLRNHGPDAVVDAIKSARPYPIEGLKDAGDVDLVALYHNPAPGTLTTGTISSDAVFRPPADGRLIVVTGFPTCGKTSWMRFISIHTINKHKRRWLVFSPEHQPIGLFLAECIEVLVGKPFHQGPTERMTEEEVIKAKDWLAGRMVMLVNDANDTPPTVAYIIEHGTAAVLRYGVTDLLIDPWNEVAHSRGEMSETDYTGQALQQFKAFCHRHGCNVWIVAHPSKPMADRRTKAPGGYDISGCYSADTDVLARRGWIAHADVRLDDEICCFDPIKSSLSYQRPSALHAHDHAGEMHHYTGYSLDLLVTPNHRMLLQAAWDRPGKRDGNERLGRPDTWSHDGWEFAQSIDLRHAKYRMPLAAPLIDEVCSSQIIPGVKDQLAAWEFIGWFVTEGWWAMAAPAVCQAAAVNVSIRASVVALGLPFTENFDVPRRANEQMMWRARLLRRGAEVFCDWLLAACSSGAPNKRLPEQTWNLPLAWKQVLFDSLMAGDGHVAVHNPNRLRQGGAQFATTSRQLADQVQRLAIELGRYASISSEAGALSHHHRRYSVVIGHPDRTERVIVVPRNRSIVEYSGMVYCLTVPTGAYVTRHNGKMAICGNSQHWANKADCGITVHQTEDGVPELHVWKVRNKRWGKRGEKAEMYFDQVTGIYREPITNNIPAPPPSKRQPGVD